MALQDNSSASTYTPQQVAAAFVKQYYQTLRNSPEHTHQFYSDSSTFSREDSNGNMTSVTTMHGINAQIMSTDYTGYVIELETVDTQASYMGGVLILVTGTFTTPDAVKRKFTQSFFLSPQGNGSYFVLNDMLRFVSEMPSTVINEVLASCDNESTHGVTLPAETETASANESTVLDPPSAAASLPDNHTVTTPSANGVALDKNDAGVEVEVAPTPAPAGVEAEVTPALAVKVATPVEKATPASNEKDAATSPYEKVAPTSPAEKVAPSSPKDATKRTYASIVKEIRQSHMPIAAPAVKSKPSPRPKSAQNAEKPVTSPPKSTEAINTAPPVDKPKNKQSDDPGYSIFVKNLPYDATVDMVEQEFRKFGAIKPGGIQVRNSQSDGFCFGFVEFESQHSMHEALEVGTIYFGSWKSFIEEKKTKTRVVNGVVTRGDDNGNAGGNRFQSGGRGGYQGDNFRGRGNGYGNYHDGDNMRNGYRNQNGSGRGQGPRGNGYYQNKNGYHQKSQNVNQQRRPIENANGTSERANGPIKQTPAAA